jgi:hypothetical protein
MADVSFFTTAVQGSNVFNSVGDFLLAPVRLFAGEERSFCIIKDEHGQIQNTLVDEAALRSYAVVRNIFAVMLAVAVVPVVVGFAFKCIAVLCGSLDDYNAVQQMKAGLYLTSNGLSTVPTIAKPDIQPDADLDLIYDINQLLAVWEQVGKGRYNYLYEKGQLTDWLQRAPLPATYQRWLPNPDEAAGQVVVQLKMILRQFDQGGITNEKKEKVILEIIEKSNACPPTWVEFTSAIYMNLLTGGFRDYVLRLVQQFKENIVLHYVQVILGGGQWHKINAIRYVYGSSLGLVTDNLDKDNYYHVDPCDCFNPQFEEAFYGGYSAPEVVCYLEGEMHTDAQQHDELIQFLTAAAQKDHPGLSIFDLDAYVKATYFHPFKGDLTKSPVYQDYDRQMEKSRAKMLELQQQLDELDADNGVAALNAELTAIHGDETWKETLQKIHVVDDQIAEIRGRLPRNPKIEQIRAMQQEAAPFNEQRTELVVQLQGLHADNLRWAAALQERSQIIARHRQLLVLLQAEEELVCGIPQRRQDEMAGIELESRRLINPAGVSRLLLELGILTQVN